MDDTDNATARPWKLLAERRNRNYRLADPGSYERDGQDCYYVAGPKTASEFVADIIVEKSGRGRANANLFVRAVNAHDAMVAACKAVLDSDEFTDMRGTGLTVGAKAVNVLRAALALARGEESA